MTTYRDVHVRRGHWHGQDLAPGSRFHLRLAPLDFPTVALTLLSHGSRTERIVPPQQITALRAVSGDQTFFSYALPAGHVVEHRSLPGPAAGPWELLLEGTAGEIHLVGRTEPPTAAEWEKVRERMEQVVPSLA